MLEARKWSIQRSLHNLLEDEVGRALVNEIDETELKRVAQNLVEHDVYRCATMAKTALSKLMGPELANQKTSAHVEHLLWCAWRSVRFVSEVAENDKVEFIDLQFAQETSGNPTVIVTPMVLAPCDIFTCISLAFPDRKVVIYGEEYQRPPSSMLGSNVIFATDTKSGIASIMRSLREGGVFCTYPDFVYAGHATVSCFMLGQQRQFSKTFISICAKLNAMLLPVQIERVLSKILVRVCEPITISVDSGTLPTSIAEQLYLQTIARLLESAILCAPEQWQLLGTLSAEINYDLKA